VIPCTLKMLKRRSKPLEGKLSLMVLVSQLLLS
jgi:hypothetical protein